MRNLIATESYQEIFPTVALAVDSKSAGRWNTNSGGEYYACGIGSSIAGRGADLCSLMIPIPNKMLLTELRSVRKHMTGSHSVREYV